MARVTLLALGSRGDVQPFVALGAALTALGHHVSIAAPDDYRALVEDAGLEWRAAGGSIHALMDPQLVHDALDAANHALPLGFARRFLEQIEPLVQQIMADCAHAARDADLLVASSLGMYPGSSIAEARRLPLVPAHMHPFGSTATLPDVSFPALPAWLPAHATYHRLTHTLAAHGLWQLLRRALNRARQRVLGLPPLGPLALARKIRHDPSLILYGYSPALAPRPADWPPYRQITGFWVHEHERSWQPPVALAAFLAAGPPPVYVGFGSMLVGRDPQTVRATVLDALERTRQRGIIFHGWGDLLADAELPPNVFALRDAPHEWLFPQLAAVVTHGGAGTTAAALRAGVPTVVVPFFGDQRLWGAQVARLGAGPAPIPRAQLNSARLAHAINEATQDQALRQRAAALGEQLRAERGAFQAAALLHTFLKKGTTA